MATLSARAWDGTGTDGGLVLGGYQPEPSPDGKSLAYVGYTHEGYDLFVMPLDESEWLDPLPYEESRPAPPPDPLPVPAVPAYWPASLHSSFGEGARPRWRWSVVDSVCLSQSRPDPSVAGSTARGVKAGQTASSPPLAQAHQRLK